MAPANAAAPPGRLWPASVRDRAFGRPRDEIPDEDVARPMGGSVVRSPELLRKSTNRPSALKGDLPRPPAVSESRSPGPSPSELAETSRVSFRREVPEVHVRGVVRIRRAEIGGLAGEHDLAAIGTERRSVRLAVPAGGATRVRAHERDVSGRDVVGVDVEQKVGVGRTQVRRTSDEDHRLPSRLKLAELNVPLPPLVPSGVEVIRVRSPVRRSRMNRSAGVGGPTTGKPRATLLAAMSTLVPSALMSRGAAGEEAGAPVSPVLTNSERQPSVAGGLQPVANAPAQIDTASARRPTPHRPISDLQVLVPAGRNAISTNVPRAESSGNRGYGSVHRHHRRASGGRAGRGHGARADGDPAGARRQHPGAGAAGTACAAHRCARGGGGADHARGPGRRRGRHPLVRGVRVRHRRRRRRRRPGGVGRVARRSSSCGGRWPW